MSAAVTATATSQPITANAVLHLFPEIDPGLADATNRQENELAGYDEEQVRLMEEVCIVLDEDDNPIGSADKKTCSSTTVSWRPEVLLAMTILDRFNCG